MKTSPVEVAVLDGIGADLSLIAVGGCGVDRPVAVRSGVADRLGGLLGRHRKTPNPSRGILISVIQVDDGT